MQTTAPEIASLRNAISGVVINLIFCVLCFVFGVLRISIKLKRYRVQRSAGVRFKVGQLSEIVRRR